MHAVRKKSIKFKVRLVANKYPHPPLSLFVPYSNAVLHDI